MKKILTHICVATLLLCTTFSFPTFAATFPEPVSLSTTRSSEYISSSLIDVRQEGNGQFSITFSVYGTGKMTRIGAKSIVISEKVGGRWNEVTSYDQYDDGMSRTNATSYANTIYFDGDIGTEYRFKVTVFAQNSFGSDTESETFILTAV